MRTGEYGAHGPHSSIIAQIVRRPSLKAGKSIKVMMAKEVGTDGSYGILPQRRGTNIRIASTARAEYD